MSPQNSSRSLESVRQEACEYWSESKPGLSLVAFSSMRCLAISSDVLGLRAGFGLAALLGPA